MAALEGKKQHTSLLQRGAFYLFALFLPVRLTQIERLCKAATSYQTLAQSSWLHNEYAP
ncbi:hypothetical protein HMPREF1144_0312 [Klebsiella sp. OBRC7]|nr:hypothetical protein HMPREF1144_0312 [Klebsiella sp. OBRC7]